MGLKRLPAMLASAMVLAIGMGLLCTINPMDSSTAGDETANSSEPADGTPPPAGSEPAAAPVPPPPPIAVDAGVDINLEAGASGKITATVTGGSGAVGLDWEVVSGSVVIEDGSSETATIKCPDAADSAVVRVTANDIGSGTSASDEVTVTCQAPPPPPTPIAVDAGADKIIKTGLSKTVTATVTGATGTVTYEWEVVSGSVTLDNATTVTATVHCPNTAGIAEVRVTANDSGTQTSDSDHVSITCNAPPPPPSITVHAGPDQVIPNGGEIHVLATVTGATGTVTYEWTVVSGGATLEDEFTDNVVIKCPGTLDHSVVRVKASDDGTHTSDTDALAVTCEPLPPHPPVTCAPPSSDPLPTPINVAGTFDFAGDTPPNTMQGTITFEQTGDQVKVAGTTYSNTSDRELMGGPATITGNTLLIQLIPINGDTNYTATVTLVFSDDGSEFCVEFNDTNGDLGGLGSYIGVRQTP